MSRKKERHFRSKSSGTKSVEYRSVLDNLPSIIATLQANKAAGESLCLKLKQKEWVNVTDDPPPQEVMKVVLNRIKDDVSQFHVFMNLIGSTAGLDLIMKQIEETMVTCELAMCTCYVHVCIYI